MSLPVVAYAKRFASQNAGSRSLAYRLVSLGHSPQNKFVRPFVFRPSGALGVHSSAKHSVGSRTRADPRAILNPRTHRVRFRDSEVGGGSFSRSKNEGVVKAPPKQN